MRLLVTGAAGFVGSHYVRSLLSGSYPEVGPLEVTVYDKLTEAANLENLAPVAGLFRFVHGDICDAELLDEVLPGHDAVINFAAEQPSGGTAGYLVTNVVGVQTLFGACVRAGTKRVVQVSSDDASGGTHRVPATPYAASKAAGDLLAGAYATSYGLPVSVVRGPGNYGPYQHPDQFVPRLLTDLIDGTAPQAGGARRRSWLHVDDYCRAVALVLERGWPGRIYDVGGGIRLSDRELSARLLRLDRRQAPAAGEEAPEESSAPGKALRALGYRPLVDFDEGLIATLAWYRENESWWRPLKEKAGVVGR